MYHDAVWKSKLRTLISGRNVRQYLPTGPTMDRGVRGRVLIFPSVPADFCGANARETASKEGFYMLKKTLISSIAAISGLCLFTGTAQAQNGEMMISNGLNNWTRRSYVDFATTTIAGHANNPTGTFAGVAGLKYKSLQVDNGNLINSSQCFEVFTSAPMFMPAVVADTRIWIVSHLGAAANPKALNDNSVGTFSAARVWLQGAPSSFVNLRIASKFVNGNTMHFSLNLSQLPLTEAACTTGQAKPWVKVINGVMTISANAS